MLILAVSYNNVAEIFQGLQEIFVADVAPYGSVDIVAQNRCVSNLTLLFRDPYLSRDLLRHGILDDG